MSFNLSFWVLYCSWRNNCPTLVTEKHLNISHALKYTFTLPYTFGINITFLFISRFGKHTFWSQERSSHVAVEGVSNLDNGRTVRYFGNFPTFCIFLDSNQADVVLVFKDGTIVMASISYSIIDHDSIVSNFTNDSINAESHVLFTIFAWHTDILCSPISSTYFKKLQTVSFSYSVQVDKFMLISLFVVDFMFNSLTVIDGPGTRCPVLCGNTNYKASTFHIVVHVNYKYPYHCFSHSAKGNCLWYYVRQKLKYSANRNPNLSSFKIRIQNETFLTLPDKKICKSSRICLMWFETNNHQNINVTLSNLVYKGKENTYACDYGGLAVYNTTVNKYHEIDTVCVKEKEGWTYQYALNSAPHLYHHYYNINISKYSIPDRHDIRNIYLPYSSLIIWYSFKSMGFSL